MILQDAYITWTRDEDDNQWVIRNSKGEAIGYLPAGLEESVAMGIIHQMRKFERDAYSAGVDSMHDYIEGLNRNFDRRLGIARKENERISAKLEQLLIGNED